MAKRRVKRSNLKQQQLLLQQDDGKRRRTRRRKKKMKHTGNIDLHTIKAFRSILA
jgi:hypothetical protein